MIRSFGNRRPRLARWASCALALSGVVVLATCSDDSMAPRGQPSSSSQTAGGSSRPNIILIQTDDQALGDDRFMTNLRQLIRDAGVTVSNYFVTTPLCCPSRSSLLVGRYPHNHGIVSNAAPLGGAQGFRDRGLENQSLAVALQNAGYRTALFGKYLNGYGGQTTPPGWTRWKAVRATQTIAYRFTLVDDGKLVWYGLANNVYLTDLIKSQVVETIKEWSSDDAPFFLYVNPYAPRGPPVPAARHLGRFTSSLLRRSAAFNEADMADKPPVMQRLPLLDESQLAHIDSVYSRRLEMLSSVDEMIRGIVDALGTTGVLDNTYIIFTSDNGFHLGAHRLLKGTQLPYEEDIRVPFYARGPGIPPGSRVDRLAINNDLAPTLAEIAGAVLIAPPDGRSLLATLKGNSLGPWRRGVLAEMATLSGTDNEEDEGSSPFIDAWLALRTERYSYIEWANGDRELYDQSVDSIQARNIYRSADRNLIASYSASIAALRQCSGESCRMAEDAVNSAPTTPPSSNTIVAVAGQNGVGPVGQPIQNIEVAVRNSEGRRVDGVQLTFTPSGTGGTKEVAPVTGGATHTAAVRWTLGCESGKQYLRVSAPGVRGMDVSATAQPGIGPPTQLSLLPHQTDSLPVAQSRTVTIRVTDFCGVPRAGVDVQWTSSRGQLSPSTVTSDAEGYVTTAWTVGTRSGLDTAIATIAGTELFRRVVTRVLADVPALLQFTSGRNQRAMVSTALPSSVVVLATDQYGNRARNHPIVREANAGGSVSLTPVITDNTGVAPNVWLLGPSPGIQELSVRGGTATPIIFTATAIGPPMSTVADSGNHQTGQPGIPLTKELVVRVRDAIGQAVPDVRVVWSTANGTIVAAEPKTDTRGRARAVWTPATISSTARAFAVAAELRHTFRATVVP